MLEGKNLLDNSKRMGKKYDDIYKYKLPTKYSHKIFQNNSSYYKDRRSFTIEPCKDYGNILKEIEKILNEGGEYIPSKFNIENWKKKYHKYTYYGNDDYYDSYSDDYYDNDDDCNGYDEWGGFYKKEEGSKYNREIITVRYGLYFRD